MFGILALASRRLPSVTCRTHIPGALRNTQQFTTISKQYKQDGQKSFLTGALKKLGMGKLRYTKSRLKRSGYRLFIGIDDQLDFPMLTKELDLDDTFFSYYLLSELHVWLLMCRLSAEGEDGKLVKQSICEALWEMIDTRSKKMDGVGRSTNRTESVATMGSHFNAAMFNYDEGILSDDKTLSAAVWRTLYNMQDIEPTALAKSVCYVRKQIKYLDEQDSMRFLKQGIVNFLPLDAEGELTH